MMGRISRFRIAVPCLLIALLLNLTGCSSWQQTHAPAEPVATQKRLKRVRAHLVDGRVVVLRDPWFTGDTLYGLAEVKAQPSDARPELYGRSQAPPSPSQVVDDSTAIPIAQIASLEAWQSSSGKTALLVIGMLLGIYIGAAVAAASAF